MIQRPQSSGKPFHSRLYQTYPLSSKTSQVQQEGFDLNKLSVKRFNNYVLLTLWEWCQIIKLAFNMSNILLHGSDDVCNINRIGVLIVELVSQVY